MAALPVATYIDNMCPLLAASAAYDMYVELATDMTDSTYFGAKYTNYAIALRAMHNFSIDRNRSDGEAGLVTAKSEGRVSIHYWNQVPEHSASDLHMTTYGKRLLMLMRSLKARASVANGSGLSPDSGLVEEDS